MSKHTPAMRAERIARELGSLRAYDAVEVNLILTLPDGAQESIGPDGNSGRREAAAAIKRGTAHALVYSVQAHKRAGGVAPGADFRSAREAYRVAAALETLIKGTP